MSSQEQPQSSEAPQDAPERTAFPLDTGFPIRLADVVLYDLAIERFPEHMAEFGAPGGTLQIERAQPLVTGQRLEVGLAVHIRIPREEDPAVTISFRLNGVYEVAEGTSKDLIDAFVAGSVVPQLWPYARELAQSLSLRLRILPIVLPPIALQLTSPVPTPPAEGSGGPDDAEG